MEGLEHQCVNLTLDCRRLFLRGWRPFTEHGPPAHVRVNVEIWVRYAVSSARTDDLIDVLDYNVMRNALMNAGQPDSQSFVERALHELMKLSIEMARVEIMNDVCGVQEGEFRIASH